MRQTAAATIDEREAQASVGGGTRPFRRILLAIDEHEDPDQVLQVVTGLAGALSSEVTVFHLRERRVLPDRTIAAEAIQEATAFAHEIATTLVEHGVDAGIAVDNARPDQVGLRIIDKAEEIEADLIVIGGHRPHSVHERLFGDVGRLLAHESHTPVLFMPAMSASG